MQVSVCTVHFSFKLNVILSFKSRLNNLKYLKFFLPTVEVENKETIHSQFGEIFPEASYTRTPTIHTLYIHLCAFPSPLPGLVCEIPPPSVCHAMFYFCSSFPGYCPPYFKTQCSPVLHRRKKKNNVMELTVLGQEKAVYSQLCSSWDENQHLKVQGHGSRPEDGPSRSGERLCLMWRSISIGVVEIKI